MPNVSCARHPLNHNVTYIKTAREERGNVLTPPVFSSGIIFGTGVTGSRPIFLTAQQLPKTEDT